MGRVNPPKVSEGESVTAGPIEGGISAFRDQAETIDSLNVRDEALGPRQIQNDAFVRDYSSWSGRNASELMTGLAAVASDDAMVIPRWLPDRTTSVNGPGSLGAHAAVKITCDQNNNDSSIIRVSCGIYMKDYGFQTYRRNRTSRFKGPIIKCVIGYINPDGKDYGELADASNYTQLQDTIQWFQLPWSGAKWNEFGVPKDGDSAKPKYYAEDYGVTAPGKPRGLAAEYFDDWNKSGDGENPDLQITPYFDFDTQSDPPKMSPMTFDYNFNYHATAVWTDDKVGTERVFALICQAVCETMAKPAWESEVINYPCGRLYGWSEDTDGDGSDDTVYSRNYTTSFRKVRHSVTYPGFYIRNCTMNALTYVGGN